MNCENDSCRVCMTSYVCQVWWHSLLLWCNQYSGYDNTDRVTVKSNIVGEMSGIVVVLSWKQYGWYHIYWIWFCKYLGCDVIYIYECEVIKSSCDVMHTECDVIHIVCVMSYREWVCYNGYTVFDDTDTVDVVSDIEGEMADKTFVLSCVWCPVKCVWCHECSGCNVITTMVWSHKEWTRCYV